MSKEKFINELQGTIVQLLQEEEMKQWMKENPGFEENCKLPVDPNSQLASVKDFKEVFRALGSNKNGL